ncbi:MAG: hypothetical protein O3B22_06595 [Proteobacteria bacterium]|nr:hypothetical protein [Pseudomonadota bacterium]MDA0952298.1 hypothetical protein [Pseudomonadota bacterium]MDA1072340.1 hypothetical protein [Pseudomonadota bacterium]
MSQQRKSFPSAIVCISARLGKRNHAREHATMAADELYGSTWTASEIAVIVADYFAMLRMELAGESYVKSHRNAALQELTGRSKGSIERKHQNISAVLQELCAPWVAGYKPLGNY